MYCLLILFFRQWLIDEKTSPNSDNDLNIFSLYLGRQGCIWLAKYIDMQRLNAWHMEHYLSQFNSSFARLVMDNIKEQLCVCYHKCFFVCHESQSLVTLASVWDIPASFSLPVVPAGNESLLRQREEDRGQEEGLILTHVCDSFSQLHSVFSCQEYC